MRRKPSAWRSAISARRQLLSERLAQTGGEMNEARMRMTRIPDGAELVHNKVSAHRVLAW